MSILRQLQDKGLIFDGGMGSLLQAKGLRAGELPEVWNITRPEVLREIHAEYLAAGCDVVTANTFGANPFKYASPSFDGGPAGKEEDRYTLQEVVGAALSHARFAVSQAGHGYVALDLGPTGRLLQPMGDLAFEDCVDAYAQVVREGAGAGADLILIETMSDLYELKAALLAAKENCDLPVMATVAFDASGKLLTGGTVRSVVALLEGLRADALGLNCGLGPADMLPIAKELIAYASVPVIIQPNAGLPRVENGRTVYDLPPSDFSREMKDVIAAGARGIGGCCGTTPAHIAAMCEVLRQMPQQPDLTDVSDTAACGGTGILQGSRHKTHTLVTGFADATEISEDPVIIGERINPTGKKRFQQALKERDMSFILQEGLAQQEAGAHILDVNVGIPGVDEASLLVDVVQELQSVTELPLQLDTSDPAALAAAMRIYNGKPLINSVNGKQASMDAVFPLVQKYGGVVVCLTLDEQGIPETAEGRVRIARHIVEEAAKYGIEKKDLLIDTLCMTISSGEKGSIVSLEALRRIREELGVKTVLGVSNISFGLPAREIVNGVFFAMALEDGLNAAIMNPASAEMKKAYHAFRALKGYDAHCADYIEKYQSPPRKADEGNQAQPGKADSFDTAAGGATGLFTAIRKGVKDKAVEEAAHALATRDALTVIHEEMMPALDEVGRAFEKGTLFLPQLIMSAEAAKAAFDVIRNAMGEGDGGSKKKGKIVLATVKGDIHDIGKNIVKVLLENYNYDVIDLGKDVSPEQVLEAVQKEKAPLVGLSALMTTTVPAMEETIRLLHEKAPGVKVMVGGAVMTAEYAAQIGADHYAKDAMGAVACAQECT